jgi:phosphoserine phosphatase
MSGKLDYAQSLRERVKLLKGLRVEELEELAAHIELTPGAFDLLLALKDMGYKLALISGGFTFFTDKLKRELGFNYAYGNRLVIKNGVLTGELEEPIMDAWGKQRAIEEIAEKEGIPPEEIVVIGDGATDRIMIEKAGLGLSFNAKEVLKKVADGSITKNHLKGLLYCLGIREDDLR